MNRTDVIARLKTMEPALRASGVASLFLYGSYARKEARSESDIDTLVDIAVGHVPSFACYMDTYHQLEDAFPGSEGGFGTRENLVPIYRPYIESGVLRVF